MVHSPMKNMKFILTAGILGCLVGCLESKPTFLKVVPVPIVQPVIVPKVEFLGLIGGLLQAKAALVGDVLQTVAGVKSGIANSLISPLHGAGSIVSPVYAPAPAESNAQYPAAAAAPPPPPLPAPPPVPSTSYGTPAFR